MNTFNLPSLINLLGFSVGIALYVLLFVMVARYRPPKRRSQFDYLLLATSVLGILWNLGELSVFIWRDFFSSPVSPFLTAVSYAALGFLPSVVVHSVWRNKESVLGRAFAYFSYALSTVAGILHLYSAVMDKHAPSSLSLRILTFGSLLMAVGLVLVNYRQTIEKKTVWVTALLIFALSTLHLNSHGEGSSWFVELVAHQSSLPLALVILYQDYRFAFADLFLKRAFSLILLTVCASGLYVFVASPLLRYHETHDRNDVQAVSLIIILWVATALVYPTLHRVAVWFVDKVVLRRVNYEELRLELAREVNEQDKVEDVLKLLCRRISPALTADNVTWSEVTDAESGSKLPLVNFTPHFAEVSIPTTDAPYFKVTLEDFSGGRHLLSDEIETLESIALVASRRIDSLRVTHERCEQEIREQEFSKLATEAQLSALRAQINPHFLFNALTTIGYLIQSAPDKAFSTLMRLTQLLRGVLRSTGEFSSLGEELKLIESYLEIESARFEERLQIDIEVSAQLREIRVPSLILQPLVENAIKHGISKLKEGGSVKISGKLKTKGAGPVLELTVEDSGAGFDEFDSIASGGIGLENIRERLRNHYGESASLKISAGKLRGTIARLTLPVLGASV